MLGEDFNQKKVQCAGTDPKLEPKQSTSADLAINECLTAVDVTGNPSKQVSVSDTTGISSEKACKVVLLRAVLMASILIVSNFIENLPFLTSVAYDKIFNHNSCNQIPKISIVTGTVIKIVRNSNYDY